MVSYNEEYCWKCDIVVHIKTVVFQDHTEFRCPICFRLLDTVWNDDDYYLDDDLVDEENNR